MRPAQQRKRATAEPREDLVGVYLTDIGKHPLLTKEDEARLSRSVQEGLAATAELHSDRARPARRRRLEEAVRTGEEAKRSFVNANLRLVVSIAKRYQASGVPLLDLIQEGNLGLIHAVEKFDWRKGFKFSTYATWWIRQAIQRGIANSGRTIRLPVHAGDRLARALKARDHLEMALGRAPTPAEWAAEADLTEAALQEVLRAAHELRSLSERLREDSDTELGDVLADGRAGDAFDEVAGRMLADDLEVAMTPLDPQEQQVLRLRFGLDQGDARPVEDVAELLGLPRDTVRTTERRALAKLRHPCNRVRLDDLLAAG